MAIQTRLTQTGWGGRRYAGFVAKALAVVPTHADRTITLVAESRSVTPITETRTVTIIGESRTVDTVKA